MEAGERKPAGTNGEVSKAVEVVEYTDPFCSWAWSTEPKLRLLRAALGPGVGWRQVVGVLLDGEPERGTGRPRRRPTRALGRGRRTHPRAAAGAARASRRDEPRGGARGQGGRAAGARRGQPHAAPPARVALPFGRPADDEAAILAAVADVPGPRHRRAARRSRRARRPRRCAGGLGGDPQPAAGCARHRPASAASRRRRTRRRPAPLPLPDARRPRPGRHGGRAGLAPARDLRRRLRVRRTGAVARPVAAVHGRRGARALRDPDRGRPRPAHRRPPRSAARGPPRASQRARLGRSAAHHHDGRPRTERRAHV